MNLADFYNINLMNLTKITIITLLSIVLTRFIPHPPNFTSLIAISFYIPLIFGIIYTAMPLAIVGSYFFDAYEAQQKALIDPQSSSHTLQKLLTPRAKLKCEKFQREGKSIMTKIKSELEGYDFLNLF